jgi:hypothetical protein
MSDVELVRDLLSLISCRCCVCNEAATRVPFQIDRSVQAFSYKIRPKGGGVVQDRLITGDFATVCRRVHILAERYQWNHSTPVHREGNNPGPYFCDEHGFDGPHRYLRMCFTLHDKGDANLIREALVLVQVKVDSNILCPTRFERILESDA